MPLQRNDTGASQQIEGVTHDVAPGEVIDHPDLITGFTPVDAPEPAPAEPPAKKSPRGQKATGNEPTESKEN